MQTHGYLSVARCRYIVYIEKYVDREPVNAYRSVGPVLGRVITPLR